MALEKEKTIEENGLTLNYQKIIMLIFEDTEDYVEVKIGVFASKEASHEKKSPAWQYYVKIPLEDFKGNGNILEQAYNILKTYDEFNGAKNI